MKLTKDGFISLRIFNPAKEDGGHYTCCATNVVGRDTTSAELDVEGGEIDETSYVGPDALRRMLGRYVHVPAISFYTIILFQNASSIIRDLFL